MSVHHWPRVPLGDVCEINPRLPRDGRPAEPTVVTFVPMAAVDETSAAIVAAETRPYSAVKTGFTPFRDNDVLFAKITPCMENGKIALARDLANGLGFGSTEFHVLRASSRVLPEWLRYFVLRPKYRAQAKRRMTGAVGQQRVPAEFLKASLVPMPPVPEQRRIVDLLSRAENIVRMRREAEAKTKEVIPALFLDMFGDPARNERGWDVRTIGDVASYTRYGPRFPDRKYAETGAHILRTTDMDTNGTVRWDEAPVLPVTEDEAARFALKPGTIVITRTGATIGKVAQFRGADRPCIAGAYLIELGLADDVESDFLLALLLSRYGQSALTSGSRAVAQPNLNAPTIRAIGVPIPPRRLQAAFTHRCAMARDLCEQQLRAVAIAEASFQSVLTAVFGACGREER